MNLCFWYMLLLEDHEYWHPSNSEMLTKIYSEDGIDYQLMFSSMLEEDPYSFSSIRFD